MRQLNIFPKIALNNMKFSQINSPIKLVLIAICLLMITTSCIDLEEKLSINDDRSGTISYTLDMNQENSLLGLLSGFMDRSYQKQLNVQLQEWAGKLVKQQGISAVKHTANFDRGIIFLSFDFSNAKSLNNALYAISDNRKTWLSPSYIKIKKHRTKKFNIAPYIRQYLNKEDVKLDPTILKHIGYTFTIEAPAVIKNVSADNTTLNQESTSVSQHFEIEDVINNRVNTGIKIRY